MGVPADYATLIARDTFSELWEVQLDGGHTRLFSTMPVPQALALPLAPDEVLPDRPTAICVDSLTATDAQVSNAGGVVTRAQFRFRCTHSTQRDGQQATPVDFPWYGSGLVP